MPGTAENPIEYPPLEMPEGVSRETVMIWSKGLRLDGDIYRPDAAAASGGLPGIVMSHGVGGDKLTCERYAARFAASGRVAISFSHPTIGASEGPTIPVGEVRSPLSSDESTVTSRMARDVVDPLAWVDGFTSALDYLDGEPGVDSNRLGAWGTSFGGGIALFVTASDSRIKAAAAQVPVLFNPPSDLVQLGRQRALQAARGEFDPLIRNTDTLPNLTGAPHFAHMARFRIGDQVQLIGVPTLILDAENEEMFDPSESGGAAYRALRERGTVAYYEVLPAIDHYGIYFDGFARGCKLADKWFEEHL